MRHVIVHHHLFKNAGSTVDAILEAQFGKELISIEGPSGWSVVPPDDLIAFICANPHARAVTSHQARLVVQPDPRVTVHPIVLLRHPIDRVRSVYEFVNRSPISPGNPQSEAAHALSFKGYVEWHLERHYAVVRDFQTLFLSGRGSDMRDIDCDDADYDAAISQLSALPVFGLVEEFDDSMRRFQRVYGALGLIDVAHSPRNARPGRDDRLEARLDEIRALLGMATFEALLRSNAHDLALYDLARRRFAEMA